VAQGDPVEEVPDPLPNVDSGEFLGHGATRIHALVGHDKPCGRSFPTSRRADVWTV
jgi:hypothetical protein